MRSAERQAIVTRISAKRVVSPRFYLRELWDRRSLIAMLTGRQLKSNYEMTVVGFAWWLLEPLSLTLVYVVIVQFIFDQVIPAYPLFVLIALLPYKWLAQSLTSAMGTVRSHGSLVADVYFPRAVLPITECVVGLAHFGVGLAVVPIFMAVYGIGPTWHLVFLPLVLLVQLVFTLGLAYPLAVWGLNYRNLQGLTGNLLRLWFYLSPSIWQLDRVDDPALITLIKLNPFTGLLESYRGAILTHHAPGWELAWTAAVGMVAVVAGGRYFMRREAQFGKQI